MAYAFGGSLWVLNISVTCTQHFTASSHVNASWLSVLIQVKVRVHNKLLVSLIVRKKKSYGSLHKVTKLFLNIIKLQELK